MQGAVTRITLAFVLLGMLRPWPPAAQNPASGAPPQDVRPLTPGSAIERELSPGQSHAYRLTASAGDFMRVTIAKKGVDVAADLIGPDGVKRLQSDAEPDLFREEVVVALADVGGAYTLIVRSPPAKRPGGRYSIVLDDLRPAIPTDDVRIDAERAVLRGRTLLQQGRQTAYVEALKEFTHALDGFRQLGDRAREVKAVLEAAFTQLQLAHNSETLELANQGERLARETGNEPTRAEAIRLAGWAIERLGDLPLALKRFEEAAAVAHTIGSRAAESKYMNDAGIVYARTGETERASVLFEQAIALAQADDYKLGERTDLLNLATAYNELGDAEKALDMHRRALAEFRASKDLNGQALTLNNMANDERELGRARDGLAHLLEALALAREAGGTENEARVLNTIGRAHFELGEYREALDYERQSAALRRQTGDLLSLGQSLEAEGRSLNQLGDHEAATAALRESLAISRQIADRALETNALRTLALVERDRGNLAEAVADIRLAVDREEERRAMVTSPELRGSFTAFEHGKYELFIDLLEAQHRAGATDVFEADALTVAERARARVLLESVLGARVDLREGIDPALAERERALQKQIDTASTRLSRSLASRKGDPPDDGPVRQIDELTRRYQELQAEIRRQSPRYAGLTQPQPLTAADIQHQVLDDDTVLLEFGLGDERSWLWAVTPTTLTSVQLPPRREIDAAARVLYERLTARQPRPDESPARYAARVAVADAGVARASETLSNLILGGVARPLTREWRGKRLAIVATDSLEYVPFTALPRPDIRPSSGNRQDRTRLAADHEIVMIPSASVLAAIRRQTIDRTPAPHLLAILADPVFERSDPRVTAATRAGSSAGPASPALPLTRSALERVGLGRLPFSRTEADAIAALAGSTGVSKAIDFRAARANAVDAALSGYRIVHFATHGLLDSERPALSGLVLSLVDSQGMPQNGYIRLHDIYNMRLDADLVVLSACQTALGKAIKGEGLVGLTRAFMYAGAPRVVASLWEVNDLATAELMKVFYRGLLQQRLRPAAALRAAQIETSHDPRWAHPYFWAGFVIQGDWN
jgi:tetratricopeptide (TPR) repeat protein